MGLCVRAWVPEIGHFLLVKMAVSGEGKVVESRGQVWCVERGGIVADGWRFQVPRTYGSGVVGVQSWAIERNGVGKKTGTGSRKWACISTTTLPA